ncbi:mRNA-decapping enzyme subunit 2 [Linderina pennispora]|nr:mRNA-decapping enzyme subunit 2 [Linderina pennispora]
MPDYKPSNAASITADIDHAKWPIRTVLQYTETKRVPTMLVRISDVHSSDVDSSAVLVDPTGEMRASVHKQVMRKYGQFLAADSSIVLRDVVSMKMPGTPPFLVVTEASIEKIFAPDHANRPGQITVSQMNRPINLVTQDSVHQMTAETPSRASKQPAQENPMLGSKNQQQKAIDLDTAQPEQPADDLFDLGSIDMSFFNDD